MDERDAPAWRTWLSGWADEVATATGRLLGRFERDYGFAPGPNEVRLAGPTTLVAVGELRRDPLAAEELDGFYEVVEQVTLPDVGNGLFIHRAELVVAHSREEWAVFLPAADDPPGLLFGSTGGGLQYVIDQGGCIYRSTTASLEGEFEVVAPSLREFLERFRHAVVAFADAGVVVDV